MNYTLLAEQLQGLIEGENDPIANLANCSALLWMELPISTGLVFTCSSATN